MYHFWSIILYGRQKVVKNLILFYIPEENRCSLSGLVSQPLGNVCLKCTFHRLKSNVRKSARMHDSSSSEVIGWNWSQVEFWLIVLASEKTSNIYIQRRTTVPVDFDNIDSIKVTDTQKLTIWRSTAPVRLLGEILSKY